MIQAGDPSTRSVKLPASADSLNTYTIPSEFHKHHFHKKGALAAAREGNDVNPEMRSSGTHFYIVKGTRLTDNELDNFEKTIDNNIKQGMFTRLIRQVSDSARLSGNPLSDAEVNEIASVRMFEFLSLRENYKIPEDQRIAYKTEGGVPRLDMTYTVFGEVLEGLDIVDRIASVETDSRDKPLNDIKILKMRIVTE
jgi:cyclophilin family peptidyl-prolyl cis-trans isomerase